MFEIKLGSFVLVLGLGCATVFAQSSSKPASSSIPTASSASAASAASAVQADEQPAMSTDEIIRRFSEKEKSFRLAREQYTYRQDVRVQTLDYDDRVTGEYHMVTDILFDDKHRRIERVVSAPPSTLQKISLTPEDMRDLESIQPFVLTSDDIGKYRLTYSGKDKIDAVNCYVFEVEPRKIEKGQRYFQGRIWVDDHDLQIVKTYGKAVPDLNKGGKGGNENLFPRFETYREEIDGFWFPTYTRADDTLNFSSGAVKIREIVRYDDYKKFQATVKLRFGDVVDDGNGNSSKSGSSANSAPLLDPSISTPTKSKP